MTELRRRASDQVPERIGIWLKWEVVTLLIQFLILGASIIYTWAAMRGEVQRIKDMVDSHMAQSEKYVREDVWKLRNTFIDEKLDSINRKLDTLIEKSNKR